MTYRAYVCNDCGHIHIEDEDGNDIEDGTLPPIVLEAVLMALNVGPAKEMILIPASEIGGDQPLGGFTI